MSSDKNIVKLKTTFNPYWVDNSFMSEIYEAGEVDLKKLSDSELKTLVSELDRRFFQLYHKVMFESKE